MKHLIIICAIAVSIVTACKTDNIRSFIPGTYINNAGSEYSIANDTLVIEPSKSNIFYVHRKTGFNLVSDGKIGKREHETENWNAVFDEETETLTETKKDKLITFFPDSAKLKVGNRSYQKIN